MLNRLRKFLNLNYYTSELDQFLSKYRRDHQRLSASQAAEKKKYDHISKHRDQEVSADADKKTFWSKF